MTVTDRRVVLDASAVVALLADAGEAGAWVAATLVDKIPLAAAPLITLDVRLARAPGPRCQILSYSPR